MFEFVWIAKVRVQNVLFSRADPNFDREIVFCLVFGCWQVQGKYDLAVPGALQSMGHPVASDTGTMLGSSLVLRLVWYDPGVCKMVQCRCEVKHVWLGILVTFCLWKADDVMMWSTTSHSMATFAADISSWFVAFSLTSMQLESSSLNSILGMIGAKFLWATTGSIDLASFAIKWFLAISSIIQRHSVCARHDRLKVRHRRLWGGSTRVGTVVLAAGRGPGSKDTLFGHTFWTTHFLNDKWGLWQSHLGQIAKMHQDTHDGSMEHHFSSSTVRIRHGIYQDHQIQKR